MGNPIILYDNRFLDSDLITATGEDADYPIENLTDYRTYTFWKDDAFSGSRYITVDCGASKSADCLAIAGHNLYSIGATISVESSSDNFSADVNERLAGFAPSSNYALMKTFNTANQRYWRLKIINATEEPRIAVLLIGDRLDFPYPPITPYAPYSEGIESLTHVGKTGATLGSVIQYHPIIISPRFELLTTAWVFGDLKTFWDSHGKLLKPFFWAWDLVTYPTQVYFVVFAVGQKFNPTLKVANRVESIAFKMLGRIE